MAHDRGPAAEGWLNAAIAWQVCLSIYEKYGSKKDPLFNTKQADFRRHAEEARKQHYLAAQLSPSIADANLVASDLMRLYPDTESLRSAPDHVKRIMLWALATSTLRSPLTMHHKLTPAQKTFMDQVDGKLLLARNRREQDGTIMPYHSEMRTVDVLVKAGILKWVHAGKDGYLYNGVVRVTHQPPAGR